MISRKMCLEGLALVLGLLAASPVNGQILHANDPLPSFEVATIKPWKPSTLPVTAPKPAKMDPVQHIRRQESDRVDFIGQIDLLIMEAYNLPIGSESRILGGPKWVDSEADRYEVVAKIDATLYKAMQQMTPEQQHEKVALLEQSLLAERFGFRAHFEMHGEAPVYALVVDQGGPKLARAKVGETTELSFLRNQITARAVTINQFASSPLWTPIGKRFVVDQTGLEGAFDFTLKWRPDSLDACGDAQGTDDLPPLFDAIREQLGLKVIDSKAPQEVIVIDRIERPSRN